MAQRRMFSKDITNSEEFLEMPDSTQKLYFHLGMNADDDGFIQPKGTMRLVRSGEDDLKVLEAKGFLISFNGSVIVITHWKMNNDIKNDRKKETIYTQHLKALGIGSNKEYIKKNDKCIQNVSILDTQVSIEEDRIGKISIGESIENEFVFYGEFKKVKLKIEEYKKLIERFGEKNTKILIDELDTYIASRGKRYSSHYATILNWARRKFQEHKKVESNKKYNPGIA